MRFIFCFRLLALAPAAMTSFHAQAQKPSLNVADTTVTLGAKIEPVLTRLRNAFVIEDADSPSGHAWLVSKKAHDFPIATIYTRNGTITGASQSLSQNDPESALDLFNVIYKASSRVAAGPAETSCKVTTNSFYTADETLPINKNVVRFDCGPYSFYILRNTFQSQGKLVSGFVAVEQIGIAD